jgi:hypothetical protein
MAYPRQNVGQHHHQQQNMSYLSIQGRAWWAMTYLVRYLFLANQQHCRYLKINFISYATQSLLCSYNTCYKCVYIAHTSHEKHYVYI